MPVEQHRGIRSETDRQWWCWSDEPWQSVPNISSGNRNGSVSNN